MTATVPPVPPPAVAPGTTFLLSIDLPAGRIAVHGDFDRLHVEPFLDAVAGLEHSPAPRWRIDLADITFCDAGGLRGLVEARRLAEGHGRSFRITRAGAWMRCLLDMAGLSLPEAEWQFRDHGR